MLSIVIPILNEQENIQLLYDRLVAASPLWKETFEVIMVDDGSTDNSVPLIKELVQKDDRFKLLKLSRNFGHQAAITAGLNNAIGDAVVVMDGDLQDPPEELHRFLEKWREGYHIVYAIRTKRKESLPKRFAYYCFYRVLALISEIKIPLDSGDFCVMDRAVIDVLKTHFPESNRFVRGLRAYAGFKQIGVKYEREERAAGEVKYTFRKLVNLAFNGLFDFSLIPLHLATYLGFIISILSFISGFFLIIHRIADFKLLGYSPSDVPGMASLGVGIFFLGGITLMVLGIIGNYIGRIYIEVKKRPTYIVEDYFKSAKEEAKSKS